MTDTDRGTAIRMLLDLLPDLCATSPWLDVPWPDFPLWMQALDADHFTAALRHDGRVDVRLCEPRGEWGCVFIASVVDVVRDVELPPVTPGKFRDSISLPAADAERCELFVKAVA